MRLYHQNITRDSSFPIRIGNTCFVLKNTADMMIKPTIAMVSNILPNPQALSFFTIQRKLNGKYNM